MSWWNPFKNKKSKPKDISKKFLIIGIGNIGIYLFGLTHRQGHQIAQKRQGLPGAKGDTESRRLGYK